MARKTPFFLSTWHLLRGVLYSRSPLLSEFLHPALGLVQDLGWGVEVAVTGWVV